MKRHAVAACAAVLILVASAIQTRAAETPEAFATALYRGHFARHQRWAQTFKRERARFTPELLAMLDEDARRQAASPEGIAAISGLVDVTVPSRTDAVSPKCKCPVPAK